MNKKVKTVSLEIEHAASAPQQPQNVIGEIAAIDEQGRASVTFPGNRVLPVLARSTVDAPARAGEHPDALLGASVLLVFENGDPELPIITGFLNAALRPDPVREELRLDLSKERDIVVDGERIVLDAKQEVLLRCGKSTILMRRDGKVMVRGTDVLSRSAGANRIKGANIRLN